MTADKLADAILNKCDIYYGGALISKEADNNFLAQPVFGEPGPICEFISFVARDSKNGSKLSWAEGDRDFV